MKRMRGIWGAIRSYFLSRSVFARRVSSLVVANFLAQAIALAALPFITRTYSPTVFGFFTAAMAIVMTATPLLTWRFDWVVQLPASEGTARTIYWLGMLAGLGGSVLLLVLLLSGGVRLGAGTIAPTAQILTAGLAFVVAAFALSTQMAYRLSHFREVATQTVWQSAVTHGLQVGLPLVGAPTTAVTLLSSALIARLVSVVRLHWEQRGFVYGRLEPMVSSLSRYWRFPIVFAPSSFLNGLGSNMPVLLVAAWYGPIAAGLLGVAHRVSLAPSYLLGSAVSRVFMAEISSRRRRGVGGARALYLKASSRLLLVAGLVSGVLVFLVPDLLTAALGGEWADAGELLRIIGVAVFFNVVAAPLSAVFIVYERALTNTALDLSRVVMMFLAGWGTMQWKSDLVMVTAAIFSAYAVNQVITWGAGLWVVSQPEKPESASATGRRSS